MEEKFKQCCRKINTVLVTSVREWTAVGVETVTVVASSIVTQSTHQKKKEKKNHTSNRRNETKEKTKTDILVHRKFIEYRTFYQQ